MKFSSFHHMIIISVSFGNNYEDKPRLYYILFARNLCLDRKNPTNHPIQIPSKTPFRNPSTKTSKNLLQIHKYSPQVLPIFSIINPKMFDSSKTSSKQIKAILMRIYLSSKIRYLIYSMIFAYHFMRTWIRYIRGISRNIPVSRPSFKRLSISKIRSPIITPINHVFKPNNPIKDITPQSLKWKQATNHSNNTKQSS